MALEEDSLARLRDDVAEETLALGQLLRAIDGEEERVVHRLRPRGVDLLIEVRIVKVHAGIADVRHARQPRYLLRAGEGVRHSLHADDLACASLHRLETRLSCVAAEIHHHRVAQHRQRHEIETLQRPFAFHAKQRNRLVAVEPLQRCKPLTQSIERLLWQQRRILVLMHDQQRIHGAAMYQRARRDAPRAVHHVNGFRLHVRRGRKLLQQSAGDVKRTSKISTGSQLTRVVLDVRPTRFFAGRKLHTELVQTCGLCFSKSLPISIAKLAADREHQRLRPEIIFGRPRGVQLGLENVRENGTRGIQAGAEVANVVILQPLKARQRRTVDRDRPHIDALLRGTRRRLKVAGEIELTILTRWLRRARGDAGWWVAGRNGRAGSSCCLKILARQFMAGLQMEDALEHHRRRVPIARLEEANAQA